VSIRTDRLELVAATVPTLDAALASREALGRALSASVPETWPPEFLDESALSWLRDRLQECDASESRWWMWFILFDDRATGAALIGTAGFKGPPDADGTVEVGYGIVSDQRRRRFATEATQALIERAFGDQRVRRVVGETLPELVGSQGVMQACGMVPTADASAPGMLRYELQRTSWMEKSGGPFGPPHQ
jgi:[ribosomal protein S5]-alanine N-acetyltransferase